MQGLVFANRFSRDWSLLKKEKERLCGHPDDQQESRSSHCEHYERPKLMIVRLPTQRAFFFHSTQVQPESAGGLHRKKKTPIVGRSQAFTEHARDGGRV